jgi:hypothetical protein
VPSHPLLNYVFNALQGTTFDLAIEVLVELVTRHEDLPQVLLYKVQFLRDTLLKPALINADLKIISGLACLMSEIGQAAPCLIVEASSEALILTDAILSCVTFPSEDWEIADSTVQFWYFIKLSYNPYGLSYLSCHPPIRGIFSGCSLSSDLILSFLILGQLLRHIYLA